MSIKSLAKSAISKAKSFLSSYGKNVAGGAKIVGGAVSSVLKKGTGLASVSTAILPGGGRPTPKTPLGVPETGQSFPPNMSTPYGPGRGNPDGSVTLTGGYRPPTGGNPTGRSPIYGSPVSLSGGQRPRSPSNLIASSFGFTPSLSGSINSASMVSAPSISLPSAPSYSNPGPINNGGLISTLADTSIYDPNTNSFQPVVAGAEGNDGGRGERLKLREMLNQMIPQKDSVFEDREVQKQQREVRKQQQMVADYTARLNSVVAQQNADLLRLREIGSQEGVTEPVYGGQAATINREAAIKALPIQAQVAAAQGSLELAQDYLTQLTTWKQEQINNDYEYRKNLYSSIADFVTGEEKIILDRRNKEVDRVYDQVIKNTSLQDSVMKDVLKTNPELVSRINNINPSSPTFRQELSNVLSAVTPTDSGGGSPHPDAPKLTSTQLNTGSSLLGLSSEEYRTLDPEVQKYFATGNGKSFMDALSDLAAGDITWEEVMQKIQAAPRTEEVKQYLHSLLNQVARPTVPEQEKTGLFGNPWTSLKGIFK